MKRDGILVGLTGQTGAGKSMVSRYLKSLGHRVVDADAVSRLVVEKGSRCLDELTGQFGSGILLPDGSLDRERLGNIVFSDAFKKKRLEEIIFPYIQEETNRQIEQMRAEGAPIVFLDAPTLIESGGDKRCDVVLSVIAPRADRLNRIIARDGISPERAELRMSAQHGDEYYTSRSGFVIVNDGDIDALYARVDEVLAALEAGKGGSS